VGERFDLGRGVTRVPPQPYQVQADDPLYRPLHIYTIDAGEPRAAGAQTVLNVPWEPLEPGPRGALIEVDPTDGDGQRYAPVNLDEDRLLLERGLAPTPADPRFHQQMTYAVCTTVYHAFRKALGRDLSWGFDPPESPPASPSESPPDMDGDGTARADGPHDAPPRGRLLVRPYAMEERNAYYDGSRGELRFGYYRADERVAGTNLPRGLVFTSLSHDIVAHETTHALLDGLRARFTIPTGPDVLAFHEALADLVAVFQHFSYEAVVNEALRRSRGDLRAASLLTEIGRQFGHTTANDEQARALRSAFDVDRIGQPRRYDPGLETHELASILVSAVFDGFVTVFERKTERYRLLATHGSNVLPPGDIPSGLRAVLAEEATQLANQFLAICIRAVDYCPPVDIEFGEYLRALITADRDLVRDDQWNYREALIAAFRARGIYAPGVRFLAEDALLWQPPIRSLRAVPELSFATLRFRGDPARAANSDELRRQACELGRLVSHEDNRAIFGLAAPGPTPLGVIHRPCVESVRASRRVGPDGQIAFDLVAEVTQRYAVSDPEGDFDFHGGATILLDPHGKVRFVISKSVLNPARLERQRRFLQGTGATYWGWNGGRRVPAGTPFRFVHQRPRSAAQGRA
jgi:hypothetical protein